MPLRTKRRETEEEGEISITPMLDVVFILLIFFIVTTSFIKETGIDPKRPLAETADTRERGNILVGISRWNSPTFVKWWNWRSRRVPTAAWSSWPMSSLRAAWWLM